MKKFCPIDFTPIAIEHVDPYRDIMDYQNLSIAELKQQAARLREQAAAIDAAIMSFETSMSAAMLRAAMPTYRPPTNLISTPKIMAPLPKATTPLLPKRKGKQPGSISAKWKQCLIAMANVAHAGLNLSTEVVAKVVLDTTNRNLRPSQIKRQFQAYVDAGYLVVNDEDNYEFTEIGHNKIGFKAEHKSPPVDTEGLSVGDVAERLNAPDSKSGGGVPDSPPPVGSNPTVSVPISPGNLWDPPQ